MSVVDVPLELAVIANFKVSRKFGAKAAGDGKRLSNDLVTINRERTEEQ